MVRMLKKKRLLTVLLIIVLIFSVGLVSGCGNDSSRETKKLTLWYTQEELKDYLKEAAEKYEKKTGIEVSCQYKNTAYYYDEIYRLSLDENEKAPDIYLTRHDKLVQICMQGIAATNVSDVYNKDNYCKTALESAIWNGKVMGYPLYYNTVCMMYNTDYFKEAPVTMGAITAFSETAEIGENVSSIFAWDINEYFYNYSFIGEYLEFVENKEIANDKTVHGLQQFQAMGQYFAIDDETVEKEQIVMDFLAGRTLCILTDSDTVSNALSSVTDGGVMVPYGISKVCDVTDELKGCSVSYTWLAVVNGMSLKQDGAADFVEFLTWEFADELYDATGHYPAADIFGDGKHKKKKASDMPELSEMYKIYAQSKQFPSLLETQDLDICMDNLFANVWDGSDISMELQAFEDKMKLRLNK